MANPGCIPVIDRGLQSATLALSPGKSKKRLEKCIRHVKGLVCIPHQVDPGKAHDKYFIVSLKLAVSFA